MQLVVIIIIVIFFVIVISKNSNTSAENSDTRERRAEAEAYFALKKINEEIRKDSFERRISDLDAKYAGFGIIECQLAGLFYRTKAAKFEVSEYLSAGAELNLRLDKKNQYDKYAVKVMYNGKHIGFIPMEYSKQVHDYIILNFGYIVIAISNVESYNEHFGDDENIVELKLYPRTENNCNIIL